MQNLKENNLGLKVTSLILICTIKEVYSTCDTNNISTHLDPACQQRAANTIKSATATASPAAMEQCVGGEEIKCSHLN